MRNGVFAYTWDLVGDPAAAERFASLGVETVTLQAAYHSVRATTAWHPQHRVVHADYAAAYFRFRPERWAGRRLRPAAPAWGVDDPDRFGTAKAALTSAGLDTEAWLVLTHSSSLGRLAPDLTVRNAFGERFAYALCPAQAEVREYALTLVQEVCDQYDVPALVLEACGWLGFEHGSHHEKTDGADLSACARDLLSICFCTACSAALADRGIDVIGMATDIRATVDQEMRYGVPVADGLVEVLGRERAEALFSHRRAVITGLVTAVASLANGRKLLLMATDDPQVTGPDAGIEYAGLQPNAFVVKCWDDEEAAIARVKAAAARTAVPLIANVNALGERPSELPSLAARLIAAGAAEIRYYHAGLASPARQTAIRAAVRETG